MLGSANVTFLECRGSTFIDNQAFRIDAQIRQQMTDALGAVVGADNADQRDAPAERTQHGSHAAGPAQSLFALVGMQENDRRLLADSLGVSPDVPVQHDVAQDQHARLLQALHQVNQLRRHPCLLRRVSGE